MMNQTKKNIILLMILLLIGLIAGITYWVWVKSIALPIKGELPPMELESVSGEKVRLGDGKIRLISFVEGSCAENCHHQFEQLKRIQERLKEYGSFGDAVEMMSVAQQSSSAVVLLEQLRERYGMDPKGWYMLAATDSELETIVGQLKDGSDTEGAVYLIDATGRIRQSYDLNKGTFIEEVLDDITQLIRLQQQSLDQ